MKIKFIDPLQIVINRYAQIWSEDCLTLAIDITNGIEPEGVAIKLFNQKLRTLEYIVKNGCCPKHTIMILTDIQNQN